MMKLVLTFVLALVLIGCGAHLREQIAVANAMALASNEAIGLLVGVQDEQGDRAIDGAPDEAAGLEALDAVEERWEPVWVAVEAFAQAHGIWVDTIESGGALDIIVVLDAYCGMAGVIKPYVTVPTWMCP